jgi:type VI secretion system protein ImpJ
MRQLQAVLWTKGVLLTPQHLQTQDHFLEDLLQFQLFSLAFFPWGFQRLVIDREALDGGVFALSSAAGILPDGLLFDMPDSDKPPAPKPLEDCWEQDQETLDVFLAIPESRQGGFNISSDQPEASTRFRAEVVLRRDENTGLTEKPIQVARKNFRLAVEGESLDGTSYLPVARVRRLAAGGVELDAHFVPPLLDIGASDYVMAIARGLVEILTAKSTAISATRRQKNQSLADFGISDVANFWLLYTVNTHLPQLRHLLETSHGHPGELFKVMLSLAGALTTFSSTVHPRDLQGYDHADLSSCFGDLDQKLRELLETVVPARCETVPLRLVQPTIYAAALDQERYLAAPQLFLAFKADIEHTEAASKVPQLVKISSSDRIDSLIKQALPGIQLSHVAKPPSTLPVRLDYSYFALGRTGSEWDAVALARNLAVYVPSELPNVQLELIVILPAEDS